MKKILTLIISACFLASGLFAAETVITRIDEDKDSIKFGKKVDGFKDVTVVNGAKAKKQNPISISLAKFNTQEVNLTFSGDIKIDAPDGEYDMAWMINDFEAGFPELCYKKIKPGKWVSFKGSITMTMGKDKVLYLSKAGLPLKDMKFYIKNLNVKVETSDDGPRQTWLEVPSLKDAYKNYFKFGLAVTFKGELDQENTRKGLVHQAETITLGNALKPDFLFAWQNPREKLTKFTDSTGKTIEVPANLPKFKDMDTILTLAKENNLKIRGHVLTWHSQTPHWFFTEGYSHSKDAPYVDRETMNARHEWYIKSVLEHVAEWEALNKCKEHVIWVWDVVNEAARDGATENKWLREDSDWYRVYQDETFIVNAFRFANKYAPKDVLLCYNDYGTYSGSNMTKGGKTYACLKIIDAIQAAPDARIDVMGMQSHMSMEGPEVTGNDSFETALHKFLEKGLDVHVTEMDLGHSGKYSPLKMKERYKAFFEMFLKNRAVPGKKGITCVTLWGLTDASTWLDNQSNYKGNKQHPLLFEGKELYAKPAFYGVLEAAEEMDN